MNNIFSEEANYQDLVFSNLPSLARIAKKACWDLAELKYIWYGQYKQHNQHINDDICLPFYLLVIYGGHPAKAGEYDQAGAGGPAGG